MSTQKTCGDQTPQSPDQAGGREAVWREVQRYYGEKLKGSGDITTGVNQCEQQCTLPDHLRQALSMVHPEVACRYYGCGLVIPEAVEGCSVLDLGCGTGRDCYAVSKLVGEEGRVVGVDMTQEQLSVARQYVDYHREQCGYTQSNVTFLQAYIEDLSQAGLQDNSFHIEISNGVFNLCPDKKAVFKEAFRVLKEGGELYFGDVFTDTHLSADLRRHPDLWGQCVAGALQWQDLYTMARDLGFSQPRLVNAVPVDVSKFSHILGGSRFVSATYRMFKVPPSPRVPVSVTYRGAVLGGEHAFTLDHHTAFKKDESLAVDGELAAILSSSRFRQYFSFSQEENVTPVTSDPKVDPFQVVAGMEKVGCA